MKKGKDRASKLFFSDPERAKEMVKLVLNKMNIKAKLSELSIEDPVVSFLDRKISIERLLDKLYRVTLSEDEGSTFCLIGLENQSKFDAHMLIRAGIASLLIYDWTLSLKEELSPVFMVVLNMSDEKWKGPSSLEDYFSKEVLALLGPLMVNVRMLVIDPHEMEDEELDGLKADLDLVLKVVKYKSDKKAFCDYINREERFTNLDELTSKLISELINIEIGDGENGMCKAIEDLIKDSKAEGEIQGEANAIYKLRRDGIFPKEFAAERLGLSVEEYTKREDRFFS